MTDAPRETVFLSDYTPPAYLVDKTELIFQLSPTTTRVKSRIMFRPNPKAKDHKFFLHGEHLKLISAQIDGRQITPDIDATGLRCDVPDAPFVFEAEVEIAPEKNTALQGLYMSNGMYCSQCEAQGFRRITYYPDRPDVLAPFTVRIEGNLPVLLSNGNPMAGPNGMIPGPNPPICLRWSPVIWSAIRGVSPPCRARISR